MLNRHPPQVKGVCSSPVAPPCFHSGCGLEFQEKKLGSLKRESLRPGSGSVKVSGADFFLGRSFGTARKSGASVVSGVDGALLGPPRVVEGRGVSEMEMAGGKEPIFRLVASCVARSYSRTSSMVMSVDMNALHDEKAKQKLIVFVNVHWKILEGITGSDTNKTKRATHNLPAIIIYILL